MRIWAAVLVVLALSACDAKGNAGVTPPVDYAHSVCAALHGWTSEVKSAQQKLNTELNRPRPVPEVKAAYVAFFDTAAKSTEAVLTAYETAGVPNINNGHDYHDELVRIFDEVRLALTTAKNKFGQLPENDLAQYAQQAKGVAQDLSGVFTTTAGKYEELNKRFKNEEELTKALNGDAECKNIGASPGTP